MAQIKKPEIRSAILESAQRLFASQGYNSTTLAQIARDAGVSSANVYVYFRSKLAVLYAIYDPWMRARLVLLEHELAGMRDPALRLRRLLEALWRDIPAEENGFVNNIMQAISGAGPEGRYQPALLRWMEQRIGAMLLAALPARRRRQLAAADLAHWLVMALDGYAIHHHLNPRAAVSDATLRVVTAMILGAPVARRAVASRGRK